ncbi:Hypothetical predicted protein [Mytilus galloprovincialis]|uniref:Uncharacterized protein n=1 Tax=Mytilus galloprovincialis TaxID=29158 RepID=A0A8B6D0D6_MYTGA|nr:Hypothetical predicted protein [Mytilus galloprovincialis]
MELSKKIREKKIFSEQDNVNNGQLESDDQVMKEEVGNSPSDYDVSDIDDNMSSTHSSSVTYENYDMEDNISVNSVKIKNNQKPTDMGANETKLVSKEHVQNLVRALIGNYEEPVMKWWWFSLVLFGLTSQFIVKENVIFQKMSVNSVKIENNQKSTDIGANDTKLEEPVMKWWWFSLVLFGLTSQFIVKENVIFQKMSVNSVKIKNNQKPTDMGANETKVVSKEHVQNLVRALIGKALSFLFGTVSDSDLSKIRRNIKTLAQNQDAIRHSVQDWLTILITTQTHVSENRHKVNELNESVEELGNILQTFATDLEKQIEVMGSHLQAYLHMDMIIAKKKSVSSGSNATNDGHQMVSTQMVGTEVPDSREKIPSAPLLKDDAKPKTDATSLLRKMYPELDTSTTS